MKLPSTEVLAAWLGGQRWFGGRTRRIVGFDVEDGIVVGDAVLVVARVRFDDGGDDRYALPLAAGDVPRDALEAGAYATDLFDLIGRGARVRGEHGEIVGEPTHVFPAGTPIAVTRRIGGEQSNTSVALGDVAMLKHFRRLAPGPNPEQEITRFLTERAGFAHAPRLFGHVTYRSGAGESYSLAVAHELARDAEDGWSWMVTALGHALAEAADPAAFVAAAEPTLAALERLGDVTAALHRALASDPGDADFAPEPVDVSDVARWSDAIARQFDTARAELRANSGALGGATLPALPPVGDGLRALLGTMKTRHHGDFHLGQTLYRPAAREWLVIDFEGEPLRPIAERRAKHAPLRDVAGLLRSIDYAAAFAAAADPRTRRWEREAASRYLAGYRRQAAGAPFVPATEAAFSRAVAVFVLEKAAYEIVYEARHRPDWVRIPVEGLTRAASAVSAASAAA